MLVTMQTLVYAAGRSGIEEFDKVRAEFRRVYGNPFVTAAETDYHNINDTIRQSINLIMPENGWKVARIMELARSEGIQYHPTARSYKVLSKLKVTI